MQLYIGLMSGTSMDGIDVALIDLTTNQCLHGLTYPYNAELKCILKEIAALKPHHLGYFSQVNTLIGREFAKAVLLLLKQSNKTAQDIIAIGSHGQTICHNTEVDIPYTVQLGCAHTIAEVTGITVVADFRTRDLVLGGQGAPFAPIYHQALFKEIDTPLAVVNIGGIANLTFIKNKEEISGYDIGPGNCLMDEWIHKNLAQQYDKNGEWAAQGTVIQPLLTHLLNDAYFLQSSPKSIGREYFSLNWLQQYCNNEYSPVDIQATLLHLTALTIANSLKFIDPKYLFICGGGAHNHTLLNQISLLLPEVCVLSTQAVNINPNFVEACMFAWLAEKALNSTPINLKTVTGSSQPAVLGVIYPR